MPRPKANPEQNLKAYQLHQQGKGQTVIANELAELFEAPVTERTVANWIREFKELAQETVDLDGPFQWHRLDEYGLPWESGQFLFRIWRNIDRIGFLGLKEPRAPTIREMHWCWRLHLAAPDLKALQGFWLLSELFCQRELRHEILAEPLRMDDLEWVLFFRPWLTKGMSAYKDAVSRGLIPTLAPETQSELEGLPQQVFVLNFHTYGDQETDGQTALIDALFPPTQDGDSSEPAYSIDFDRWRTE